MNIGFLVIRLLLLQEERNPGRRYLKTTFQRARVWEKMNEA